MLRTMSSLCVPDFDSALSSVPKLKLIIHFPQVNALVPGLKLLEFKPASRCLLFLVFAIFQNEL